MKSLYSLLLFCTFFISCTKSDSKKNDSADGFMTQENRKIVEIYSRLRPNEALELQKVYEDTVEFIDFDDNGDYGMFYVLKGLDTLVLTYNETSDFLRGDQLKIRWKMDYISNSGDGESTEVTEWLVGAETLHSFKLAYKNVRFLWRETDLNDNLNKIKLNTDYIKNISEPEKAVLAYVASFVGNECEWDGDRNEGGGHLNCKITSSLHLGYQCSAEHLDFIRRWFKNDLTVLKDIESCSQIPDGATVQSTFNEINVAVKNQNIIVFFKATGMNMREEKTWDWTEKLYFEFKNNELKLIKKEVLAI